MKRIPTSKAIKEVYLDFRDGAKYAETQLREVAGLPEVEPYWDGTRLYFLTESIQPKIKSPTRPRVMLLFSNPYPESVKTGLFMSEKNSKRFWKILRCNEQLGITHDFRWDPEGIDDTVSLLLNGNYGNDRSPLLFLECLYPIPSKSPKDLRRLFAKADDFDRYLHRPSLDRIRAILINHNIKVVLIFTGETFESIVGKPGISKYSRQTLYSAVKNAAGDERLFWECMDKHELRKQVPNLKHKCIAVKVMDTWMKNLWLVEGRSTFSHVLDYALQYAGRVG